MIRTREITNNIFIKLNIKDQQKSRNFKEITFSELLYKNSKINISEHEVIKLYSYIESYLNNELLLKHKYNINDSFNIYLLHQLKKVNFVLTFEYYDNFEFKNVLISFEKAEARTFLNIIKKIFSKCTLSIVSQDDEDLYYEY